MLLYYAFRIAGGVWESWINLGSDEVGSVARCHEKPILGSELLREAEVADAETAGRTGLVRVQNVWRLQVSVHNLKENIHHL